jgi:hypothetical protein
MLYPGHATHLLSAYHATHNPSHATHMLFAGYATHVQYYIFQGHVRNMLSCYHVNMLSMLADPPLSACYLVAHVIQCSGA